MGYVTLPLQENFQARPWLAGYWLALSCEYETSITSIPANGEVEPEPAEEAAGPIDPDGGHR
jgi:hypothetical protein